MTKTHGLGFPRIGAQRQSKRAVEAYWKGELSQPQLLATGQSLRATHWKVQADAGIELLPVNDFSWYDHMLDMAGLLGVVPSRFEHNGGPVDLDTLFRMARGRAPSGKDAPACEMTKWFDTNYHAILTEVTKTQTFTISTDKVFSETAEAIALGYQAKTCACRTSYFLILSKS